MADAREALLQAKRGEIVRSFTKLMDEVGSESVRGRVILVAAEIGDLLRQVIRRALLRCGAKEDDLLDGDRPLSTLSARITVARRLGLIDDDFAAVLHLVRKVRNSFAHERSSASLTTGRTSDQVRSVVERAEQCGMVPGDVAELVLQDEKGFAAEFFRTACWCVVKLHVCLFNTKRIVASAPTTLRKDDDVGTDDPNG